MAPTGAATSRSTTIVVVSDNVGYTGPRAVSASVTSQSPERVEVLSVRLYSWVAHWSSFVSVSVTFTACPGITTACTDESSSPMSESAETTGTSGSSTAVNSSSARPGVRRL
ncbi:MAG: hypothetical protein CXX72_04710 [Methanobacteriota archaeon]|nr:MAG: hypothetical protein CXX72_04710 [Euryarchaeota archaeon]